MTDAAGPFVFVECFQVTFPVDQVVDLHQVEFFDTPELPGRTHLLFPVADQRCPDLGGAEQGFPPADPVEAVSDDIFGRSVHWR
jgi:hypothetical protein